MKRALHIICLILAVLLIGAGFRISARLPLDRGEFIEKKYAGWSGVLRGWVVSRWDCAGSFTSWLNRCAAAFEKEHRGVYLEFTVVSEAAIAEMGEGLRPPELLFYSPGTLSSSSLFTDISSGTNFKRGLSAEHALPVAMGGYITVRNPALPAAEVPARLPDSTGRSFSRAAELMQEGGGTSPEIVLPDMGIDLGLPAMAANADALQDFIDGNVPALVVSQKELARLASLRDSGRGPDWQCISAGSRAWADQLLLGGALIQTDEAAPLRTPLAEEFLHFLLEDENQAALASIGAFPVTQLQAHTRTSAYAEMEAMLLGQELLVPNIFTQ